MRSKAVFKVTVAVAPTEPIFARTALARAIANLFWFSGLPLFGAYPVIVIAFAEISDFRQLTSVCFAETVRLDELLAKIIVLVVAVAAVA